MATGSVDNKECEQVKKGVNIENRLLSACEEGQTELVKQLLTANPEREIKEGDPLPSRQDTLNKALNIAAKGGHAQIVETFLQYNANINVVEKYRSVGVPFVMYFRRTPLLWAVEGDHIETIKILLKWNADTEYKDSEGLNAVALAAKCGHIESLTVLLEAGCSVNWVHSTTGRSPLSLAAEHGQTKSVALLIQYGANLEHLCNYGGNALSYAAYGGHPETVRFLLDAGVNLNCRDVNGNTSLMLACQQGHSETVKILLDRDDVEISGNQQPLCIAAREGHINIAEILLQHPGITVDCRNTDTEMTPLMCAVGHCDLTELLLNWKANINCKNSKGETVLHLMAEIGLSKNFQKSWKLEISPPENCSSELLLVLKKYLLSGADVRVVDNEMKTPIQSCEKIILLDPGSNSKYLTALMSVLYPAGVKFGPPYTKPNLNRILDPKCPFYFPQFMINDQRTMLPLMGLCRKNIRHHLLSLTGGNQNNLAISIPRLPLPKRLLQFLLFEADIPQRIESFKWKGFL